jgi:pantothenate kinase type III
VNIVLTGGDAAFFAPLLRHPSLLVPDLTIQGLAIAAGVR